MKRILLQSAPGLIGYLPALKHTIETSTGCKCDVDGRGRFGACDVDRTVTGYDGVVHFGHTGFVRVNYNILYIPCFSRIQISEQTYENLKTKIANMTRIGLSSSVQHIREMGELSRRLERDGKSVFVGKPGIRGTFEGQVVGCDYFAAIRVDPFVEAHVILSGGEFHSLGLALSVSKPVIQLNPYTQSVEWVDGKLKDRVLRVKGYAGHILLSSKRIAIIDSTLPGQRTENLADRIRARIAEMNPHASVDVFVSDIISTDFLLNLKELGYEIAVTVACSRLCTDDFDRSPLPIFEGREVISFLGNGLNIERGVFPLQ
jgi:2-(3-amino-3-carboxypropyl)histidine synthase